MPVSHGAADLFLTYGTEACEAQTENAALRIVQILESLAFGADYGPTVVEGRVRLPCNSHRSSFRPRPSASWKDTDSINHENGARTLPLANRHRARRRASTVAKELVVGGEVQHELRRKPADLRQIAKRCGAAEQGGCSGIRLIDLLSEAQVKDGAPLALKRTYAVAVAADGYPAVFPWGELYNSAVPRRRSVRARLACRRASRTSPREVAHSNRRATRAGRRPALAVDLAQEVRMRLNARHMLKGKVVGVKKGVTTANIKLDVGGTIITSTITLEAAKDLKLEPGDRAFAMIKASEVITGK